MNRRDFLKHAGVAGGAVAASPLLANQLFSHAEQVNAPAQHDLRTA